MAQVHAVAQTVRYTHHQASAEGTNGKLTGNEKWGKQLMQEITEAEELSLLIPVMADIPNSDDAIDAFERLISLKPNLDTREAELLGAVFRKWMIEQKHKLSNLEYKIQLCSSKEKEPLQVYLSEFKRSEFASILDRCRLMSSRIKNTILPVTKNAETILTLRRLQGDVLRYTKPFEDPNTEVAINTEINNIYSDAYEYAKEHVQVATISYVSLVINYTLFLFKVMGNRKLALEIAKRCYEECRIHDLAEQVPNLDQINALLEILADNIMSWGHWDE